MKTIIIGDVHGCNQALESLLEKTQAWGADQLVMLGDLFDRGPDSYQVFRTVKGLAEGMGERFTLLLGNHEDYLLQPKLTLAQRMMWDRVGRGATVKSFRSHGGRMEDAIPWLKAHCQLFWRGDGIQCVHAGLTVDPIEANDRQTLLHDHEVTLKNRYAGPLTVVGHIALSQPTYFPGDGESRVKLSAGEWMPLPERGALCIDTGCGKGGGLTALIAEEGRFKLMCAYE